MLTRRSLRLLGCPFAVITLIAIGVSAPMATAAGTSAGTGASGSGAFSELTEGGKEESTTTTATTATGESSSSGSGSSTGSVLLLGLIAAAALIGGIAFLIMRDAHRVAPVPEGQLGTGRPARDPAVTMRKRRAKAKAARAQRKRNR